MGLHLKKTIQYKEAEESLKVVFLGASAKEKERGQVLVFIDECGINSTIERTHGYSEIGTRLVGKVQGKRGKRVSVVGGLLEKKLIAAMSFTGTCKASIFLPWLENELLPKLPQNSTIVMDNARFHCPDKARNIIEKTGRSLLMLPPYSPDLNKIEHCWHRLKTIVRKMNKDFYGFQHFVDNAIIEFNEKCV